MNEISTQDFIRQKFSEYYKQNIASVQPPSQIEKRELAFLLFEKTMVRHKGFRNTDDFRDFLQSTVPSDVYYSSAYYDKPQEEMDAKGWIGADLVFDIDADHILTPCNKQHDTWKCKNCGTTGHGSKPEKCPKCTGQKFHDTSWPCETCLETARKETIKLVDTLETDFGLSTSEIQVAFSGHRGYHATVENETIRELDSIARKEIVDYMIGIGLEPELQGLGKDVGPSLEDCGWKGKIAKGVYEFLMSSTPEQIEEAGLRKKAATEIEQQRSRIQKSWEQKGPWKILKGAGPDTWEIIIHQAIQRQSVQIDTVVTTDIHRIIRLANTLHGETGLKKTNLSTNEIEQFDPFKKAVAFKNGTITVEVTNAPSFRLQDDIYGPFKNQTIELPTAAAMILLCKGAATTAGENVNVQ